MANNTIDYRIKFAIESKEYQQALRKANQEAKEFKRQQREAFKNSGANEGMNAIIASAKKLAPAISASAAALAVVNKAMKENQTYTDAWARITESAKATYESFVNSLVGANFEGFFRNIDNVISRAREAADAFDALDTATIFYNRDISTAVTRAEEAQSIIKSTTASETEKAAARQQLQLARQEEQKLSQTINNLRFEAGAALLLEYATDKAANKYAGRNPRTFSQADFITKNESGFYELSGVAKEWFGSLGAYNEKVSQYAKDVAEWKKATGNPYARALMVEAGSLAEGAIFGELSDDKLKQIFSLFTEGEQAMRSYYSHLKSDRRYLSATTGGGKTSATAAEGSIAALQNSIREAEGDLNAAADAFGRHAARRIIAKLQEDMAFLEMEGTALGEGLSIGMTGVGGLSYKMVGSHLAKTPIAGITAGEYKDTAKASETAAQGVSLLTDTISQLGILSNITAPEVQQFTRTLGSILSMIGSSIGGPWGIALQGIGGIVSSFSGGGVVGGTSYKGDRLLAAVNSGEMILNGYQQKQLLDIISSGGGGGVQNISAVVRGEDIYLALSNYKRRTRR